MVLKQTQADLTVIIPCHNEQGNLIATFDSIKNQTVLPKVVYFVDDLSVDNTLKEILSLVREGQRIGLKVVCLQTEKNLFRAGACNKALKFVNTEFVLLMDAGTILDSNALKYAIETLQNDSTIGIVCSKAGVIKGKGFLHRLQKLDYGTTDLSRMVTRNNILISHGLFSMTRTSIMKQVNYYSDGVLLEDYDLTVKIKLLGYKAVYNPQVKAYTKTVTTWKALHKQRFRWYLGGLDVVTKFGYNKVTREDIFNHILYLSFFFLIVLSITFGGSTLLSLFNGGSLQWNNFFIIPLVLFIVNYVIVLLSLGYVDKLDKKDIVIRVTLIPELVYVFFLEVAKWRAYLTKMFSSKRKW